MAGRVGTGYATRNGDGSDVFDDFDGVIYGVAIYGAAFSDEQIAAHSEAFFQP